MYIKKLSIIIIAILGISLFALSGCRDIYRNMDMSISSDFVDNNIILYLEPGDGDEAETEYDSASLVTVSISGVKDNVIQEVTFHTVNKGIVSVERISYVSGVTEIKITPISAGRTDLIISSIEGGIQEVISIEVISPVKEISIKEGVQPAAVVGRDFFIDTINLINFYPSNTNQTDVEYSLLSQVGDISISSSGVLSINSRPQGLNQITVRATSTHNSSIYYDFDIMIFDDILEEDVTIISKSMIDNGIDEEIEKIQLASNLDDLDEDIVYVSLSENSDTTYIIEAISSNRDLISVTEKLPGEYTIAANDASSTPYGHTLTIRVSIEGFPQFYYEKIIPVEVYNVATQVSINGDRDRNDLTVFTEYTSMSEKKLTFEIGPNISSDKTFKIDINEFDLTRLTFRYIDGTIITNINNVIFNSGDSIIVNANNTAAVVEMRVLTRLFGLNSYIETKSFNLSLMQGISSIVAPETIEMVKGEMGDFSISVLPSGADTEHISVSIDNPDIGVVNRVSSDSFRVVATQTGTTTIRLVSANGVPKNIQYTVYIPLRGATFSIDNPNVNSDVIERERIFVSIEGESEQQLTLNSATLRRNSIVPITLNSYPFNATNYRVIDYFSNSSAFTITSSGNILTNAETLGHDGPEYVSVTAIIEYWKEDSKIKSALSTIEIDFYIKVVVPIETITFNSYGFTLYDENSLGIYGIEDEKMSQFHIIKTSNPQFASSIDGTIRWEATSWGYGDSKIEVLDISSINEGGSSGAIIRAVIPKSAPIQNVVDPDIREKINSSYRSMISALNNDGIYLRVTVYVTQFGRTISQSAIVNIKRPINVEHITVYQFNDGQKEYIDNTVYYETRQGSIESLDKTHLNIEYFPQSATLKQVNFLYDQNNGVFEVVYNENTGVHSIKPIGAGRAVLTIVPRDTVTRRNSIQGAIFSKTIEIIVADGLTKANPLNIYNYEDLLAIGSTEDSLSRHYVLASNINMRDVEFSPIGKGVGSFTGTISGLYKSASPLIPDRQFRIFNLKMEIDQDITNNSIQGDMYAGLFYRIEGMLYDEDDDDDHTYQEYLENIYNYHEKSGLSGGIVEKLIVEYLSFNINNNVDMNSINQGSENSVTYIGGIAGKSSGEIIDSSVVFLSSNIYILSEKANIGGIVGENTIDSFMGEVIDSSFHGELKVIDYIEYSNSDQQIISTIYVGGIAGINYGEIAGEYNHTFLRYNPIEFSYSASTVNALINTENIKTENSATGGISGKNRGVIRNISSYGRIIGPNNVGGIAGKNYLNINNSTSRMRVEGENKVGGLIGYSGFKLLTLQSEEGTYEDLYFYGVLYNNTYEMIDDVGPDNKISSYIIGENYVGGLIGKAEGLKIFDYNFVSSYILRDIDEDYYFGDILVNYSGDENIYVGGLIGYFVDYDNDIVKGSGVIKNSYANVNINAANNYDQEQNIYIGGLFGIYNSNKTAQDMYYIGSIIVSSNENIYFGGITGEILVDDLSDNDKPDIFLRMYFSALIIPTEEDEEIKEVSKLIGTNKSSPRIKNIINASGDDLPNFNSLNIFNGISNIAFEDEKVPKIKLDMFGDQIVVYDDEGEEINDYWGKIYIPTKVWVSTSLNGEMPILIFDDKQLFINVAPSSMSVEIKDTEIIYNIPQNNDNGNTEGDNGDDSSNSSAGASYLYEDFKFKNIKHSSSNVDYLILNYNWENYGFGRYNLYDLISVRGHGLGEDNQDINPDELIYISGDETIITIDEEGAIYIHAEGHLTVTVASAFNQSINQNINIYVKRLVNQFNVSDGRPPDGEETGIVYKLSDDYEEVISEHAIGREIDVKSNGHTSIYTQFFNTVFGEDYQELVINESLGIRYILDVDIFNFNYGDENGDDICYEHIKLIEEIKINGGKLIPMDKYGNELFISNFDSENEFYADIDYFMYDEFKSGAHTIFIPRVEAAFGISIIPIIEFDNDINKDHIMLYNLERVVRFNAFKGATSINSSISEATIALREEILIETTVETDNVNDSLNVEVYNSISSDFYVNINSESIYIDGKLVSNTSVSVERLINVSDTDISAFNKEIIVELLLYPSSSPEITNYIQITIVPQDISRIRMEHFSSNERHFDSYGNSIYYPNEISSNIISRGQEGILKINLYPEFADIDYFEITSSTNADGEYISLYQLVKVRDDSTLSYKSLNPSPERIANGTRLRLVSVADEQGVLFTNLEYNGVLYIRTLLGSNVYENTDFEITLKGFRYDESGTAVVNANKTITLNAQTLPGIYLDKDGENHIHVARGETINFDKRIIGDFDGTINYSLVQRPISENSDIYADISLEDGSFHIRPNAKPGDKVIVTAYITRVVNGILERSASSVTVEVVDFTIEDIDVALTSNNIMNMLIGQTNPLVANIKSNNNDVESEIYYDVQNSIEDFEEIISNNFYNWFTNFYYEGIENNEKIDTDRNYLNYDILQSTDGFSVRTKRISQNNQFSFALKYTYIDGIPHMLISKEGELYIFNGINEGYDEVDYSNLNRVYSISKNFTINIVIDSSLDRPIPIYTENELRTVESGIDYILMNDIYLNNWRPSDADFRSLDGNSYTVHINSFHSDVSQLNNYGLFSEIKENTIIKNFKLNLSRLFYNEPIINGRKELTYDFSNLDNINFGFIAGINNGTLHNVDILINKYSEDENYNLVFNFVMPSNSNTGSIVAINNGYITSTRVGRTHQIIDSSNNEIADQHKLRINSRGTIGGLVALNNGIINTSYVKGISISNTNINIANSITGGFVAINSRTGIINYSFVEGYDIENHSSQKGLLNSRGGIGGFVYRNNGKISDSYSNIPIQTVNRSAGFVFINDASGEITNAYSSSRMPEKNSAHLPFVGSSSLEEIQNLGIIKNTYYLFNDNFFTDQFEEYPSRMLSLSQFSSQESFVGFNVISGPYSDYSNWALRAGRMQLNIDYQFITDSRRYIVNEDKDEGDRYSYAFVTNRRPFTTDYEYGSLKNPILVSTASEFLEATTLNRYTTTIDGAIYNSNHIRLINDIDFNDVLGDIRLRRLEDIIFEGVLDGNGMKINNLDLAATGDTRESFGLFMSIGRRATADNFNIYNDKTVVVKNIEIDVRQLSASRTSQVGVLAGEINNGLIMDIVISSSNNATVSGNNITGALAGIIRGHTQVYNIHSQVNVSSEFEGSRDNIEERSYSPICLTDNEIKDTSYDSLYLEISYVGGVAGVVDLYTMSINEDDNKLYRESNSANFINSARFKDIKVSGHVKLTGERVGGIAGYIGVSTSAFNLHFELDSSENINENNQYIRSRYIAGGIVAENYGLIKESRIKHEEDFQENILDKMSAGIAAGKQNLFQSTPTIIGGLIGYNEGILMNSYSRVDIINPHAIIAGGLIGRMSSIGYQNPDGPASAEPVFGETEGDENDVYHKSSIITSFTSSNIIIGNNHIYYDEDNKVKIEDGIDITVGGLVGEIIHFAAEENKFLIEYSYAINNFTNHTYDYLDSLAGLMGSSNDNKVIYSGYIGYSDLNLSDLEELIKSGVSIDKVNGSGEFIELNPIFGIKLENLDPEVDPADILIAKSFSHATDLSNVHGILNTHYKNDWYKDIVWNKDRTRFPTLRLHFPVGVLEISDFQGLDAIRYNLRGNYIITQDIDFEGQSIEPIYGFTGRLLGRVSVDDENQIVYPTLKNFKIDNNEGDVNLDSVGLFGTIRDAVIQGFNIQVSADTMQLGVISDGNTNAALLVGNAQNSIISNIGIIFTEEIEITSNNNRFGLLAGNIERSVVNNIKIQTKDFDVSVNVDLQEKNNVIAIVGGLIGSSAYSEISDILFDSINITVNSIGGYLGGLIGRAQGVDVSNSIQGTTVTVGTISFNKVYGRLDIKNNLSFNNGDIEISGNMANVGGLFGKFTEGRAQRIRQSGLINVSGPFMTLFVGGISGIMDSTVNDIEVIIEDEFSIDLSGVSINSTIYLGGAFGKIGDIQVNIQIKDVYVKTDILSTKSTLNFTGGVVGYNKGANLEKFFYQGNIHINKTGSTNATLYLGGVIGYTRSIDNVVSNISTLKELFSDANIKMLLLTEGGNLGESYRIRNLYLGGVIGANGTRGDSELEGQDTGSSITDIQATGAINLLSLDIWSSTKHAVGGLIGYNNGPLNRALSLARVMMPGGRNLSYSADIAHNTNRSTISNIFVNSDLSIAGYNHSSNQYSTKYMLNTNIFNRQEWIKVANKISYLIFIEDYLSIEVIEGGETINKKNSLIIEGGILNPKTISGDIDLLEDIFYIQDGDITFKEEIEDFNGIFVFTSEYGANLNINNIDDESAINNTVDSIKNYLFKSIGHRGVISGIRHHFIYKDESNLFTIAKNNFGTIYNASIYLDVREDLDRDYATIVERNYGLITNSSVYLNAVYTSQNGSDDERTLYLFAQYNEGIINYSFTSGQFISDTSKIDLWDFAYHNSRTISNSYTLIEKNNSTNVGLYSADYSQRDDADETIFFTSYLNRTEDFNIDSYRGTNITIKDVVGYKGNEDELYNKITNTLTHNLVRQFIINDDFNYGMPFALGHFHMGTGTGNSDNPYLINSTARFDWIRSLSPRINDEGNQETTYFEQIRDLNFSDVEFKTLRGTAVSGHNDYMNRTSVLPISYNGNEFSIKNVNQENVDGELFYGLFNKVSGDIINLIIENNVLRLKPESTTYISNKINFGILVSTGAVNIENVDFKNNKIETNQPNINVGLVMGLHDGHGSTISDIKSSGNEIITSRTGSQSRSSIGGFIGKNQYTLNIANDILLDIIINVGNGNSSFETTQNTDIGGFIGNSAGVNVLEDVNLNLKEVVLNIYNKISRSNISGFYGAYILDSTTFKVGQQNIPEVTFMENSKTENSNIGYYFGVLKTQGNTQINIGIESNEIPMKFKNNSHLSASTSIGGIIGNINIGGSTTKINLETPVVLNIEADIIADVTYPWFKTVNVGGIIGRVDVSGDVAGIQMIGTGGIGVKLDSSSTISWTNIGGFIGFNNGLLGKPETNININEYSFIQINANVNDSIIGGAIGMSFGVVNNLFVNSNIIFNGHVQHSVVGGTVGFLSPRDNHTMSGFEFGNNGNIIINGNFGTTALRKHHRNAVGGLIGVITNGILGRISSSEPSRPNKMSGEIQINGNVGRWDVTRANSVHIGGIVGIANSSVRNSILDNSARIELAGLNTGSLNIGGIIGFANGAGKSIRIRDNEVDNREGTIQVTVNRVITFTNQKNDNRVIIMAGIQIGARTRNVRSDESDFTGNYRYYWSTAAWRYHNIFSIPGDSPNYKKRPIISDVMGNGYSRYINTQDGLWGAFYDRAITGGIA